MCVGISEQDLRSPLTTCTASLCCAFATRTALSLLFLLTLSCRLLTCRTHHPSPSSLLSLSISIIFLKTFLCIKTLAAAGSRHATALFPSCILLPRAHACYIPSSTWHAIATHMTLPRQLVFACYHCLHAFSPILYISSQILVLSLWDLADLRFSSHGTACHAPLKAWQLTSLSPGMGSQRLPVFSQAT